MDNNQITPYPLPYIPAEVAANITFLSNENCTLSVSNEKLRHQLERSHLREQAYSEVLERDSCTYVPDRNGNLQELMDCEVESSLYLSFSPPIRNTQLYYVQMSGDNAVFITADDFENDGRLINRLQQLGIRVRLQRSKPTTAALLRQAINRHLSDQLLNCYAGWQSDGSNTFAYQLFPDLSTHWQTDHDLTTPTINAAQSEAVIATAACRFLPVFNVIRTPFLRQMVILLYHEAAIHTLLQQLGYKLPLSSCLFSTDAETLSALKALMTWFSDQPLTLDTPAGDLPDALLFRKDEPLLVEDRGRLAHAKRNAETLDTAVVTGLVSWQAGKNKTRSLPLKAPIVLLSSRPSALICAPEVMVLDFLPDDFDQESWLEAAEQIGQNSDYLMAFCSFTSTHLPLLRTALSEGQTAALRFAGNFSEPCRQTFGLFLGLQKFLDSFISFVSPPASPFSALNDELIRRMAAFFVHTSGKSDCASLAGQFMEVVRRFIRAGILHVRHRDHCPPDLDRVLLYDDDCLYFTSSAFFEVCQSLKQSRPVILAALTEANLFCGAQTNPTTSQTRVTVCNEQGRSRPVPVYSFLRDDFEEFGDPLILESEEASQ